MQKYKVIAIDLDGTLTDDQKVIPQRNLDAILRAQQEYGLRVVLASGRPTYGMSHLVDPLTLRRNNGLVMAYNGAVLIDCASGRRVFEMVLPRTLLPDLYDASKELGVNMVTYDDVRNFIILDRAAEGDEYIKRLSWQNNNMPLKVADYFLETAPADLPKCLMAGPADKIAAVEPKMKERFPELSIYRSCDNLLEIAPHGIDKAFTLRRLCRLLRSEPEECLIAMGDSYNDISMVKMAAFGVAMGNGCDEVKAVADYVASGNNECGVAEALGKALGW